MRGMRRKGNTMKNSDGIHTLELPYWLLQTDSVVMAEEEEQEEQEEQEEEQEGEDDDDLDDSDVTGLKSALQKERQARRDAEKIRKQELKELEQLRRERKEKEDAEKSEIERLQAADKEKEEKLQRMAQGYIKSAIDRVIEKAAEKAGFQDPEDALALVQRDLISYEVDDDNPAEVTVDIATAEKAVKDLATRKPHYLKSGTDDGEPTGSSFGGGTSKKKKATEDDLKDKYPSLR